MNGSNAKTLKPVSWVGTSFADLLCFPKDVRRTVGFALYEAQKGEKHKFAKPLLGFGGAGVLEVVANHDGNTFRAVYTVRFAGRLYVLHVFQKKSKSGIKTTERDIRLIRSRLLIAEAIHKSWLESQMKGNQHG
jgi:phage-related protein